MPIPVPVPVPVALPEPATISPLMIAAANLCLGALGGWLTAWAKMAKYQQMVDDLKDDKIRMDNEIKALRTDVDKLNEFKVNAQKFMDKTLYKSSSPLSLTEYGQQLINESGFEAIFPTVRDDLVRILHERHPKTKYDAQEMAREVMDKLSEYPAFAPLKAYAFKTGKDFGQILRSGAIPLRDYYLSKYPEIKD